MTFDEWHEQKAKYMEPKDIVHWCAAAWEAGAAVEREACAKLCQEMPTESDAEFYGHEFAAAIRARGNV